MKSQRIDGEGSTTEGWRMDGMKANPHWQPTKIVV